MIKEQKPQGYYTDKVFTPVEMDEAVAKEREACLKIADDCADADMHASMVANAIRARSVATSRGEAK